MFHYYLIGNFIYSRSTMEAIFKYLVGKDPREHWIIFNGWLDEELREKHGYRLPHNDQTIIRLIRAHMESDAIDLCGYMYEMGYNDAVNYIVKLIEGEN